MADEPMSDEELNAIYKKTEEDEIRCPRCGKFGLPNFCQNCGHSLLSSNVEDVDFGFNKSVCSVIHGIQKTKGDNFCLNCGKKL